MKRVVFYARVSTDHSEQIHSLLEQRKYFMKYIDQKEDYHFIREYVDEGITGTSMKNRSSFRKMMYDALNHQFDLILVKDISRFARNTLDTIEQTRKLKKNGIDVIFINDHIDTSRSDGELNLTLLASAAQDESRKISNRVNWTMQNDLKNGVMYLTSIYGYDIVDRQLKINKKEAEVVVLIYDLYLSGLGLKSISDRLYDMGIRTPNGKERWNNKTLSRILTNEKYMGTLVSGKTHVINYLTHERQIIPKENQYVFENHHEAIINKDKFYEVQKEKERRNGDKIYQKHRDLLSGKIQCYDCGGPYIIDAGKKQHYYCHNYILKHGCQNDNSVYIVTLKKMLYILFKEIFMNQKDAENKVIQSIRKSQPFLQMQHEISRCEKMLYSLSQKRNEYLERLLQDEINVDQYQKLTQGVEKEIKYYDEMIKKYRHNDQEMMFKNSMKQIQERVHFILNDEQFYNQLIKNYVDKIIFRKRHDFDVYIHTNLIEIERFHKDNYCFISTLSYDFSFLENKTSPNKYRQLKNTTIRLYLYKG